MCCSVLQCVAKCCGAVQCIAVMCVWHDIICQWHDIIYAKIRLCDMTSFDMMCVTWCVWHDEWHNGAKLVMSHTSWVVCHTHPEVCVWLHEMCVAWIIICVWRERLICVSDLNVVWNVTLLYVWRDSFIWHDLFIRVTWSIHRCDMIHSQVWHVSFHGLFWCDVCHLVHACVSHDS